MCVSMMYSSSVISIRMVSLLIILLLFNFMFEVLFVVLMVVSFGSGGEWMMKFVK